MSRGPAAGEQGPWVHGVAVGSGAGLGALNARSHRLAVMSWEKGTGRAAVQSPGEKGWEQAWHPEGPASHRESRRGAGPEHAGPWRAGGSPSPPGRTPCHSAPPG